MCASGAWAQFQFPAFSPAPLVTGSPWRSVNLTTLAPPASGTYKSVEVWVDWIGEPFVGNPDDNQWSREANVILSSAPGTGGLGQTAPTGLGTVYAPVVAPVNGGATPGSVMGMRFAANLAAAYSAGAPLFLVFNQDFDSFVGASQNNARWTNVRVKLNNGFIIATTPTAFVDLGTLTRGNNTRTGTVALGLSGIRWFKFNLAADVRGGTLDALDIDTEGTGSLDTKIYLFRGGTVIDNGTSLAFDDDDGTDKRSQLSFGSTNTTSAGRPYGIPTGFVGAATFNGRDGNLTAGEYWLAVASFSPNAPANGYVVNNGVTEGPFQVNLRSSVGPPPLACTVDFNRDGVLNQEDLSGLLTAFMTEPTPAGPGGFAAGPCPGQPGAYGTAGYQADFNRDCSFNQEDLSGFLTEYLLQVESPTGCTLG